MSNNNNNMGSEEKNSSNANMGGSRRPLRRPNPETEAKLMNGSPGNQDKAKGRAILGAQTSSPQLHTHGNTLHPSNKQGSGLSANAAVFVPGQPLTSSLSATANEFVPRFQTFPTSYAPPPLQGQCMAPMSQTEMLEFEAEHRLFEQFQRMVRIRPAHLTSSTDQGSGAVELIQSTIHYLTTNPGEVHTHMVTVVQQLQRYNPDDAVIFNICESLIEQGISEPNFRYTGAKMCQFLSKNLLLPQHQLTFRRAFLKRFQQEYSSKDALIQDPNLHHRICGLTLFLGELFLNMETDSGEKFAPLRQALLDLLLTLLLSPTDMTIKTTCQLLKLAGAAIEDTAYLSQNPQDTSLNTVFLKLQEISRVPGLAQTPRMLITSVLNLRDTNWGRKDSTSSDHSHGTNMAAWEGAGFALNEPVFFDAHGHPITREQAGYFVDDSEEDFADYAFDSGDVAYPTWANDDSVYDAYDYSLDANMFGAEGGMNDEMEAAYEEFLRSQGQS